MATPPTTRAAKTPQRHIQPRREKETAMKVLAAIAATITIAALPLHAAASATDPKPIGGGVQVQNNGPLVHYFPLLPARQGVEFSSITDFNGILGAAHVE